MDFSNSVRFIWWFSVSVLSRTHAYLVSRAFPRCYGQKFQKSSIPVWDICLCPSEALGSHISMLSVGLAFFQGSACWELLLLDVSVSQRGLEHSCLDSPGSHAWVELKLFISPRNVCEPWQLWPGKTGHPQLQLKIHLDIEPDSVSRCGPESRVRFYSVFQICQ